MAHAAADGPLLLEKEDKIDTAVEQSDLSDVRDALSYAERRSEDIEVNKNHMDLTARVTYSGAEVLLYSKTDLDKEAIL